MFINQPSHKGNHLDGSCPPILNWHQLGRMREQKDKHTPNRITYISTQQLASNGSPNESRIISQSNHHT